MKFNQMPVGSIFRFSDRINPYIMGRDKDGNKMAICLTNGFCIHINSIYYEDPVELLANNINNYMWDITHHTIERWD